MINAAGNGHLEVVKWLHTNRLGGCSDWAINRAAGGGHLDMIKWLLENKGEYFTNGAITQAAIRGQLDVVEFLWAAGFREFKPDVAEIMKHSNNLDVLVWMKANVDNKAEPRDWFGGIISGIIGWLSVGL
jgi:hypothetical protein